MDDLPTQMQGYLEPLIQSLLQFIPKLLASLVVLVIAFYLATLAGKAVNRLGKKRGVDPELNLLFGRLVKWGIIVFATVGALNIVDNNIIGFVAGLGIVGFTIGFALQDIAKNFIAGILLLWQQPFDVGDTILVVGYEGKVTDVSLRATEIITNDGLYVLIPNADVYINPLTNYTKAKRRRVALNIGVGYDTDLELVTQTALQAIQELPGVIITDPEPAVVFHQFGMNAIDFTLYYWIDLTQTSYFAAQDQGVKRVKAAFAREQIDIPSPIRMMQLQGAN